MELTWLLLVGIALLVLFDFTNGFNDTANMVASVIACRAMTPAQAILLVSVFTFLGPVLGGTAVADTIGGFITLDNLPGLASLGLDFISAPLALLPGARLAAAQATIRRNSP